MKLKNILFTVLVVLVLGMIARSNALNKKLPMRSPQPMSNTTFLDTPKVYVFKMIIPAQQLQPTMDTLDLVLGMFGKSLSVDQSEQYKTLAVRNIRRLIGSPVLDSIATNKSSK